MAAQDPLAALGGIPATPVSASTPSQDPLAALGGVAATPISAPPSPGVLSEIGNFAKGVGEGAVESAGETVQSLPWIGKKIISPEAMQAERAAFAPGTAGAKAGQYAGKIAEPILEFVMGDEALKGLALADKIGLASKISEISQDSSYGKYIGKLLQHGVAAARMGTVGTAEALAKGATPGQAIATGAATGVGGEAASAALDAAIDAAPSAFRAVRNPFREILQGKAVAQEPAAAAVRDAVGVADTTPIRLQGKTPVLDAPLQDLASKEKAAYAAVDKTAGFDVKEARLGLKNDQYNLAQLGNTPADQAAKVKLTASINDTTQRLADADAKLTAAGVDPKIADNLHTARMAGTDLKSTLVRNTSPDGTINVDGLLKQSDALRFSKRGDRLSQFFGRGDAVAGKPIADTFVQSLQDAQKAGIKAASRQQLAKLVAGRLALGAGGVLGATAGYELLKHFFE